MQPDLILQPFAVLMLLTFFYNRVMHRFFSYFAGGIVLFVMILRFAWFVVA